MISGSPPRAGKNSCKMTKKRCVHWTTRKEFCNCLSCWLAGKCRAAPIYCRNGRPFCISIRNSRLQVQWKARSTPVSITLSTVTWLTVKAWAIASPIPGAPGLEKRCLHEKAIRVKSCWKPWSATTSSKKSCCANKSARWTRTNLNSWSVNYWKQWATSRSKWPKPLAIKAWTWLVRCRSASPP